MNPHVASATRDFKSLASAFPPLLHMPTKGLEPPRPYGQQILILPRLPFRHVGLFNKEAKGFEPLVPESTAVFKTAAIDHSATPPSSYSTNGSSKNGAYAFLALTVTNSRLPVTESMTTAHSKLPYTQPKSNPTVSLCIRGVSRVTYA